MPIEPTCGLNRLTIARMPTHQRFHWLVAPSSTVVQPSAVHTGLCDDPQETLDRLFRDLVGDVLE